MKTKRLNRAMGLLTLASLTLAFFAGCEVRLGHTEPPAAANPPTETGLAVSARTEKTAQILQLRTDNKLNDQMTLFALSVMNASPEANIEPLLARLQAEYAALQATTPAEAAPRPVAAESSAPVRQNPATASTVALEQPVAGDAAGALSMFPAYQPRQAVAGRFRSIGSDTMDDMMARLEEAFRAHHGQVQVIHEGRGSSTAAPALLEGRSDVGPMSRPIKPAELEKFKERFGREPIQVRIAIDTLAVYVHPSNPLLKQGVSLAQLDAVFSSTRKAGAPEDITRWGQLGASGSWADTPISVYSRNTASGTYSFFKEVVLKGGEYKTTNQELDGSADVVAAIVKDPTAIGYSGIGYRTTGVAVLPIQIRSDFPAVLPSQSSALDRRYPLARDLYLLVLPDERGALPAITAEVLNFILSREGQLVVQHSGFFPLSETAAKEERARLGL